MKFSLSKIFDSIPLSESLKAAGVTGADELFTLITDLTDQLARIFARRVSFADNIDGFERTLDLVHDKSLVIENPDAKKTIAHLIPTRTMSFDSPCQSLAWRYTERGELELRANFKGAPSKAIRTVIMGFYT